MLWNTKEAAGEKENMKKYSFYTPVDLARNILNILPDIKVESIVDICCGSWNLLQAGKEKYPYATVTGVDIDKKLGKNRIDGSVYKVMDGREFAKKEYEAGNTYDLILSNPPFGFLEESERKFEVNIFEEKIQVPFINKRYECEMMQANFLLSHENSVLIFILPYTFIAGTSYKKLRCQIAKSFAVKAIIKLPSTTFSGGNINTFAIVLYRNNQKCTTIIYNATDVDGWRMDKQKDVDVSEIEEGNWWGLNKQNEKKDIKILRGNISSGKFVESGKAILHCGKKGAEQWLPSKRYYDPHSISGKDITVQKGDVLINRIGKDAGYWCINEFDDVTISDCLLVIKNSTKEMINVLEKNSDSKGRLLIPLRGVATSYITKEDLEALF